MSKFKVIKWKFFAVIFAMLIVCAQPARALALELRIRNDFDNTLSVAVVYYNQHYKLWHTTGWYNAEPRKTRTVTFNSSHEVVYLFAYLANSNLTWSGSDLARTVINDKFSYYDGQSCPNGKNRVQRNFRKYTARNGVVDFRPAPDPSRPAAPSQPAEPRQTQTEYMLSNDYANAVRAEFYRLVNEHRAANGLRTLNVNADLQRYADVRAHEQRTRFGHTRPDGSAAGSGWYNSQNMMNTRFAENALSVATLDPNPKAAASYIFLIWRNSSGHNAHMLYRFDSHITMAFGIAPRREANGNVTSGAIFATGY